MLRFLEYAFNIQILWKQDWNGEAKRIVKMLLSSRAHKGLPALLTGQVGRVGMRIMTARVLKALLSKLSSWDPHILVFSLYRGGHHSWLQRQPS